MIEHFDELINIKTSDDINRLGEIIRANNMDIDKVNVNEIARKAGVSWDTANRRLKNLNKGYSKTKPSKVDKVKHIIIDVLNDNKVEINSKQEFYDYILGHYPDLVDFKIGAFKNYIKTRFNEDFEKKKSILYILN